MIIHKRVLIGIAATLAACLLLLTGCFSRSSPQVAYFSLLTMAQLDVATVVATLPETKLGIGPITIPDRMKRAQIVTRQHGNQYAFDEYNRWAGVLESDLTTVIGENLGKLLGTEHIGAFPWMSHFEPTYRIVVDIIQLDGALDGEAVLSARWAVADADGKKVLASGKSDYRQPLSEASFAALIKAESQLLAALCLDLAKAVGGLAK